MLQVSASIVIFHNDEDELLHVINSFFSTTLSAKLYLIDNSLTDKFRYLEKMNSAIEYTHNGENLGYGSAHNIAMRKSEEAGVKYHLVLNPDVYFGLGVLEALYVYMEKNDDTGLIMPKVLYPDGSLQYLCKLLPTPLDFLGRRMIPNLKIRNMISNKYELKFFDYEHIANIPSLSGCFMFTRTSVYAEVGMFDENIFLHTEDVDFTRRIHQKFKTIYYPKVSIYHEHQGVSVSKKVLMMGIRSAFYYFNKWGWFFDRRRQHVNRETIRSLKKLTTNGIVPKKNID